MQNVYIGSSLSVFFEAKDKDGNPIDISGYNKKVRIYTDQSFKLTPALNTISANSFNITLSGDETSKLKSGKLNIHVELKKGNEVRIGKSCPINLIDSNKSYLDGKIVVNNPTTYINIELDSTSIVFDLIMGSTIINQGGGSGGEIPTKLSQLQNDEGFITSEDIPAIPKPNQTFIDLWNVACGTYGQYNEETGYFELNGFTDISYSEALQIYSNTSGLRIFDLANNYRPSYTVRTNLPLIYSHNGGAAWNFTNTFGFPAPFEVLNLCCLTRDQFGNVTSITTNTFQSPSLKRVIGRIMIVTTSATALTGTNAFLAPKLEEILLNLAGFKPTVTAQLAFGALEVISLESLSYLVSTYSHTQVLTVKVHQSIYNKLINGASFPEWANLVTTALAKNITFAL